MDLTQSTMHDDFNHYSVLPRQTYTLTDYGHPNRFRDWVDVQKQGIPNDYARYVGPTEEFPFVWFSIALAGFTDQHTDPGLYEEHDGIVRRKQNQHFSLITSFHSNSDEISSTFCCIRMSSLQKAIFFSR